MTEDPYKILGVSPGASDDEIKRAYKQLAKKYHPDLNQNNPEAAEMMKKINEAYDILINHKSYGTSSSSSSSGGYGYRQDQGNPFYWYTQWGGSGSSYGFDEASFDRQYGQGPSLNRAKALYNMRQFARALDELRHMGEAERNAEWHYVASMCHRAMGNSVDAENEMRRAHEMDPDNPVYSQYANYYDNRRSSYEYRRSGYPNAGGFLSCCLSLFLFRLCGCPCFCII